MTSSENSPHERHTPLPPHHPYPPLRCPKRGVELDGEPLTQERLQRWRSSGALPSPQLEDVAGRAATGEWWLAAVDGRIDIILAPQREGDWFPYWEVSSGRKMAPQFRSSGVGYLRLADDMGKYGKCFLSTDSGRSFLDDTAFRGGAHWSPIDTGKRRRFSRAVRTPLFLFFSSSFRIAHTCAGRLRPCFHA